LILQRIIMNGIPDIEGPVEDEEGDSDDESLTK
jgi:hypothetical protein